MQVTRRVALASMCVLLPAAVASGNGPPVVKIGDGYVMHTRHYRVETDIGPEFTRVVGEHMEVVGRAYSRILSKFGGQISTRFRVQVLKSREDYLRLVGPEYRNTIGLFLRSEKLLVACVGHSDREAILKALRHEGFHQFMYYYVSPNSPPWVNEGLAEYFELSEVIGGNLTRGEVPPDRLRRVQKVNESGEAIPLEQLMKRSRKEWNRILQEDRDLGSRQYDQSWLLVHFLVFARRGRYEPLLMRYLKLIADGRDWDTAHKRAFGDDFTALEREWKDYVAGLRPTARYACRENLILLGKLYARADLKRPISAVDFAGRLRRNELGSVEVEHRGRTVRSDDPDAVNQLLYCPADGRRLGPTSYAFRFTSPRRKLPTIICAHHRGYVLRARFEREPQSGEVRWHLQEVDRR